MHSSSVEVAPGFIPVTVTVTVTVMSDMIVEVELLLGKVGRAELVKTASVDTDVMSIAGIEVSTGSEVDIVAISLTDVGDTLDEVAASTTIDETGKLVATITEVEGEEATTAAPVLVAPVAATLAPEPAPKFPEAVVLPPLVTSTSLTTTTSPELLVTLTSTVVVPNPL